jgi:hypothetical protein
MKAFLVSFIFLSHVSEAMFYNQHDPLVRPFADAFSSRLAEIARVKHPADVLVLDNSTVFVSSFLSDAVLRTSFPISKNSIFEIFAHGSYCTKDLRRCAILNGELTSCRVHLSAHFSTFVRTHDIGPWGLAQAGGLLYVSSFGSDQILVFNVISGEFIDALGDRCPNPVQHPAPHSLELGSSTDL